MKDHALKNVTKNLAIIVFLIFVTFKFLIRDFSTEDIKIALKVSDKRYIILAMIFALMYLFCEGINTKRMLETFGYKISLLQTAKYAFIGFFFAGLTPSASGGQPAQLFVMRKDGIKISQSSLILMMELCAFQLSTVIMALVGYYYNYNYIFQKEKLYAVVISIGILINFLGFVFIFFAIFSKRFVKGVGKLAGFFIDKLPLIKDKQHKKIVLNKGMRDYRYSSVFIKANKKVAFKTLITTTVQVSLLYSISYLVYRALGFNQLGYFGVFFLQALAYVSVSAMPLPGAIGISEKVFNFLFIPIYAKMLNEGMILTRGINFYFIFVVSATVFFVSFNKYLFGRNTIDGKTQNK